MRAPLDHLAQLDHLENVELLVPLVQLVFLDVQVHKAQSVLLEKKVHLVRKDLKVQLAAMESKVQ